MSNKLPCEIVRDMLPMYIDELTSPVTNEAVRKHLNDCEECRRTWQRMAGEEDISFTDAERQEIDFLKKTKRKNKIIIITSFMAAILMMILVSCFVLFGVTYEVGADAVSCKANVNNNVLILSGYALDEDVRIKAGSCKQEDGIVTVQLKTSLFSFKKSADFTLEYAFMDTIDEVRIGERIIWSRGMDISALTSSLYQEKNPYVGDMPANQKLMQLLNMQTVLGPFTNELHTAQEPYGWTMTMLMDYSGKQQTQMERKMRSYACVLLATIDNLSSITYQYTVDGKETSMMITDMYASGIVGKGISIKEYAESPDMLQRLLTIVLEEL